MTSHNFSPKLIDRLYATAEHLEREWVGAGLSDDFGSRMIANVLMFLDRTDRPMPDEAEQAAFATAMLRLFWSRNARRDSSRVADGQQSGKRPSFVEWDDVSDSQASLGLYHVLSDDVCAGETGREIARFLEGCGWPRERAWALVFRYSGREWEDVGFLLAERFECDVTAGVLRQWNQRYFVPAEPALQNFLQPRETPAGDISLPRK